MNTNAAFKALTAIRKDRQNQGGFSVYLVTKSGAPSKVKNRDYSGQSEFNLEQGAFRFLRAFLTEATKRDNYFWVDSLWIRSFFSSKSA